MIDRILIDSLNLKSRDFAVKWKNLLRGEPRFIHYQAMDDDALIEAGKAIFPLLSQTLDRGVDRSLVSSFFIEVGRKRLHSGFTISEVLFGLNYAQKVVIEYITTEFAPENPMRMYQSLGALTNVSDFFLLSNMYVIRGFLEETYAKMNDHDKTTLEVFRKYFKDDLFFKKSDSIENSEK